MIDDWVAWLPQLFDGLRLSIIVAILSIAIGLGAGVALAVASTSELQSIKWGAIALIELLRGVPLLVIVYLAYFGLPSVGITLDALPASVLAIGLNTGAYMAEIVRGGLASVPLGQREAASSLGMSQWQCLRVVILPQALRTAFSPLVSYSIIVFQATSLLYLIGVQELLGRAFSIGSTTFQYLSVLGLVGIMYAVVSIAGSRVAHRLESRTTGARARHVVRI